MGLQRLQSLTRLLTVVAAAAAAATSLLTAVADQQYAIAAAVLASLLLRLQGPTDRWRHAGAVGLVMAVATAVGATGGLGGPLAVALLLVVSDYGLTRSTRTVVLVGVIAAAVAALSASGTGNAELTDPRVLWALAVVPLIGVTAGQLGGNQSLEGTAALESATAALDEVLALAEKIPAGFDRWSVATAVHLELREASRLTHRPGSTPHLLLVHHGVLFGVGHPISRRPVGLLDDLPRQGRARIWTKVESHELPSALSEQVGEDRWYLHRLGGGGSDGVVLVPQDVSRSALETVAEVLRPAAVALANVERFERLEAVAISAARTRVAHDLHDGIAQALTHVRFELDLLALERKELVAEISRIRRVADSALLEVRRTVGELRDTAPLRDRIIDHVNLLRSFAAPSIELELSDPIDVPDDVADEVLRIVQEGLSNAVRHADADLIHVTLVQDAAILSIAIVDDGRGIGQHSVRGVGLGAMRSRAERIGADLVVRPRRGGGTVVELEVRLLGSVVNGDGAPWDAIQGGR